MTTDPEINGQKRQEPNIAENGRTVRTHISKVPCRTGQSPN